MKKILLGSALMLASTCGALAEGTITNPAMASRFSIDMLGGQLPRMMISYSKTYGAARESVLWDVHGTLKITYEEPSVGYLYTVHNLTNQLRLMIEMSGDELARFKECMAIMSVNQAKREIVTKLTPPQTISPWAQFAFIVEPGSGADTIIKNWGFANLGAAAATLPINNQTATHFVGCTTNL